MITGGCELVFNEKDLMVHATKCPTLQVKNAETKNYNDDNLDSMKTI